MGLGNINQSLYSTAQDYPYAFHDITEGSNVVPCVRGTPDCANGSIGYTAGPGYDPVTGLGSVDVGNFVRNFELATVTTLTASPTTVTQGQPVLFTIQVRAVNNGSTAYGPSSSQAGLYEGATAVHGTEGFPGNGAFTLTVSNLGPGTHSITAVFPSSTGFGFLPSTSAPVLVTVSALQPAAPGLVAPLNKTSGVATGASLSWAAAQYATSYDVYFGSTPSPPFWGNVSITLCQPSDLAPNTTYYWKVVSRNPAGLAASDIWSFTTSGGTLYTMNTIVGDDASGFSGDGGIATQAEVSHPFAVALDAAGNMYIADTGNHRVRKVTPDGAISTLAGTGSVVDSGDGGPAINAGLSGPYGIAVDPSGNVYVTSGHLAGPAAFSDQRIRMISPDGLITTVAGTGTAGYSGDGGPAINAELSAPVSLATDSSGNLYIADAGNNCIRKVSSGIISTVAGQCGTPTYPSSNGDGGLATSAVLLNPWGVTVDSSGRLYIADSSHRSIREVSKGVISTLAGGGVLGCSGDGGPAISAQFNFPAGLAVDDIGNIFISDQQNNVIREITNGVINTIAGQNGCISGGGPAVGANIGYPYSVAVDTSGHVFIANHDQDSIRVLSVFTHASVAVIDPGGVVSAASFAVPVSPGSIAGVFGGLALNASSQATNVPLPGTVTGLSIQFQLPGGNIDAPLFFASAGQANIQIPWEATSQSQVAVSAVLNGVPGPSQTVALAPFAPAIFTMNGQGTGQGAILDLSYRLVDSTNPIAPGGTVQIYCTGLGAVSNAPPTGSPPSVGTLSRTTVIPLVTIGGIQANVLFSGLAPESVGEYQVNVQVPSDAPAGESVPVVISVQGASSNTATIAVQ